VLGLLVFDVSLGVAQLALLNGDVIRAIAMGVTPFAALDLVKAWVAAAIASPKTARRAR